MQGKLQRTGWLLLIAILLIFGSTRSIAAKIEPGDGQSSSSIYVLHGIDRVEDRSAIAATGVDIIEVGKDYIVIAATPEQIDQIKQLGFAPSQFQALVASPSIFVDPAYHTYAQMVANIQSYAITYTNIMQLITVGVSYEGRPIWVAKISDNPNIDEGESEVLFTFHQHAREHLTVEQGLYTLHLLTDNYGSDITITQLVDTRVVWLFFDLNPDGGEYDISGGTYQGQRKNCQPVGCDSSNIGTDLNRNSDYGWGCCSGSSASPSDETYRGPSAFSEPETTVISNFVATRVI
ncbi:MAG TPA: M14 family zinc carboxypeptidase, partial [Anaerolineae bacterium]|nr:M14 family zinc carboxypeptidase [Anaerolineae bacterium]